MNLFCDCKSNWIVNFSSFNRYQVIVPNVKPCPICEYDYWYEALYEDMMFDLRNMNN